MLSVRELETGAARDVSGVLRITRGGDAYGWKDVRGMQKESGGGGGGDDDDDEAELLYLIKRDGSANVFHRGSEHVS